MIAARAAERVQRVLEELRDSTALGSSDPTEYVLPMALGAGYVGMSSSRIPTLLIPLRTEPSGVARAGRGFVLRPTPSVAFTFSGRRWTAPAAILECADESLLATFAVLASDLAHRLAETPEPGWRDVTQLVDEWYRLLSRRRDLSPEEEIGLWGEIWFLSQATDPDRLASAWRGPEGEASDFAIDGACAEIKTSRSRLKHNVSQRQVDRPAGELAAYIVSLWVGVDPEAGQTLPELVDGLIVRLQEPGMVLRGLLNAGYSSDDRHEYQARLRVLEKPSWYATDEIPRIRVADPGISNLRYVVTLDPDLRSDVDTERELFMRFLGCIVALPVSDPLAS